MSGPDQVQDDGNETDEGRNPRPGGTAASGEQSDGGGSQEQTDTRHSGYAPTDTEAPEVAEFAASGTPGGTAASGGQSEGGGTAAEGGRKHSGWGPVDGETADEVPEDDADRE